METDAKATYPESFDRWCVWSEENVRALYRRLDELRQTKRLLQKQLVGVINVTEQTLAGWKNANSKWTEINEERFQKALVHLYNRGLLFDGPVDVPESTDAFYKGALRLFNVTKTGFDLAAKYVAGDYTAYRYSNYLGGEYILRGHMHIDHVLEEGVIKTTEIFKVQKSEGVAQVERVFSRQGYLFYRDNASIIVSRKENSNDIQMIFIKTMSPGPPHIRDEKSCVQTMEGVIVDSQENDIYTTRIAFVRALRDDGAAAAVKPNELTADIRNMLSKGITQVNDYLLRYS